MMEQINQSDFQIGNSGSARPSKDPGDGPSQYHWTKRSRNEMKIRLDLIRDVLLASYLAQGKRPASEEEEEVVAISFAYALDNIPTGPNGAVLAECLNKAFQAHTGSYYLAAGEVQEVWLTTVQPAWLQYVQPVVPLLPRGVGSKPAPEMTQQEWKTLHNLPDDWTPMQPYAEGSNLYGKDGEALERHQREEEDEERREAGAAPFERDHTHWKSQRTSWEMYGTREMPIKAKVRGMDGQMREFTSWVELCPEEGYPGYRCPGWIWYRHGPQGRWRKRLECPYHGVRWTGREDTPE